MKPAKPEFYTLVYILPSGAVCSRVVTEDTYQKHMTRIAIEDGVMDSIAKFDSKDEAEAHRQLQVAKASRSNRRGL